MTAWTATTGWDDGAQPHGHDQVHDLHDDVIQRLFGVGLGLRSTLARIADPVVRARLGESVTVLDEVIGEVRAALPARSTPRSLSGLLPDAPDAGG